MIALSYRFIRSKPFIFIIISVMLGVSLVSANIFVAQMYANTYSYRIIKGIDDLNYVYFQVENQSFLSAQLAADGEGSEIEIMSEEEKIALALSKTVGVKNVSDIWSASGQTSCEKLDESARQLSFEILDEVIVSNLKFPLDDGKWYSSHVEDGYIEIVISKDNNRLKVGDTFEVQRKDYLSDKIYDIKFKVSGILSEPVYKLSYSSGASYMCSLHLIREYNNFNDMPLVLCSQEAITELFGDKPEFTWGSNSVVIVYDENLSEAQMSENVKALSDYGFAHTRDDMEAGTALLMKRSIYVLIPTAVFMLLIGIIGLISMTVLNAVQYKKHFSIFFICGCKWKQCILINLMYILYSFVFAVLILIGYIQITARIDYGSFEIYSIYNVIATAVICLLVFGLTAIVPYLLMARQTPKEILTDESE